MRLDIQVLRGLAVALVVLEHVRLGPFQNGFLGVDIFFVISGFLITGIIVRDIDAGQFSFREFYLRRARRILPAAYVTMGLTAIGSIWFLTSSEQEDLKSQILGGVTYTINFVLLGQTDYFDAAAETKPLLHLWSLAVEEQFYLLFPLLAVVTPPMWRRPAVLFALVASVVACFAVAARSESAAFYLLPTRAWELLLGSVLVVFAASFAKYRAVWAALFWPAMAGLLVVPCIDLQLPHPGVQALAVCVLTAVVILPQHQGLERLPGLTTIGRLGDISYSLYLVHWPITVFTFSAYFGEPPLALKIGIVLISLMCAAAVYAYVERPMRHRFQTPSFGALGAAASGAVAVVGCASAAAATAPRTDFAELRKPNYGLHRECNFDRGFTPIEKCANAKAPNTLVWGDSFAMHLVDGLAAEGVKLRQATYNACHPIVGQAPSKGRASGFPRRCIEFNDAVMRHALAAPEVSHVILAATWRGLGARKLARVDADGDIEIVSSNLDASLDALGKTVARLKAAGKQVVLVEPPPNGGKDRNTSICVERLMTGKIIFGHAEACRFELAGHRLRSKRVSEFLSKAEKRFSVAILRLESAICRDGVCDAIMDGVSVFRDTHHLSREGSKVVMRRVNLRTRLAPSAFR